MTKDEKLRKIIRDDVSGGFFHELQNELHRNGVYVRKLLAHPEFMPQLIDELVDLQLPFYKTVSDETVDRAFEFFQSPAGKEWYGLSSKFTLKLNELIPPFVADLVRRLDNLN